MAFKFDITLLCELVESRPCLWNKKNVNFKNKVVRERSWEEVFKFLDDEYDAKTAAEKKATGEKITNKWANVRDAFMRSLKPKSGQPAKKNYIYHQHLQFLLAANVASETESSILVDETSEASTPAVDDEMEDPSAYLSSTSEPPKKRQKLTKNDIEREILLELKKPKEPKEEKCTFFSSFEGYITDMTEMEKLKLHMDIVKSITEIKSGRLQPEPVIYYENII